MLTLVSQLNQITKEIRHVDPGAVERLRKRAKYPAREKIEKIIDPGTDVLEIGTLAAYDMYEDIKGGYPSAGTIVAVATVSGRKVVIMANDPIVKSGAWVDRKSVV